MVEIGCRSCYLTSPEFEPRPKGESLEFADRFLVEGVVKFQFGTKLELCHRLEKNMRRCDSLKPWPFLHLRVFALNFFSLILVLMAGCSSSPELSDDEKRAINCKGEFIYRHHDEYLFSIPMPEHRQRDKYSWEASYIGQHPKMTKEFFRCKGSHLNPMMTVPQLGKEPLKLLDCSGSERHSLPLRGGKEFVYSILVDLLNYLQAKTGKRVVITCGHRCPVHNLYADQSKSNQVSKHMIGAEVDFYVQGFEERPDLIVELIKEFYMEEARYQGQASYQEFKRYEKEEEGIATLPWYNQEIAIKLFKKSEGRDIDNRHPYPYLSIQVRYDRDLGQRVTYSWPKAYNNYQRE